MTFRTYSNGFLFLFYTKPFRKLITRRRVCGFVRPTLNSVPGWTGSGGKNGWERKGMRVRSRWSTCPARTVFQYKCSSSRIVIHLGRSSYDHVVISRVPNDRRPLLLCRSGLSVTGPGAGAGAGTGATGRRRTTWRSAAVATVSGRQRVRPGRGGRMRPSRAAVRQSLGMRRDGNYYDNSDYYKLEKKNCHYDWHLRLCQHFNL